MLNFDAHFWFAFFFGTLHKQATATFNTPEKKNTRILQEEISLSCFSCSFEASARNSHKVFAINSQLCSNHFAAFPILSLISNFSSPFQLFLFFPITFSLSAQTFHFSSFIVHRSPFVSLPFVSHLSFSSAAYHLPPFIFHFIFFIFHHVCKKSKSNLFDPWRYSCVRHAKFLRLLASILLVISPSKWPILRACWRNYFYSGVAQWLACWAHNPKVRGSKPRSATLHYLLSKPLGFRVENQ